MRKLLLVAPLLSAYSSSAIETSLPDATTTLPPSIRKRKVQFATTVEVFDSADPGVDDPRHQTEAEESIWPLYSEPFSSSCWFTEDDIVYGLGAIVYSGLCLVGQYHTAQYLYSLYQYYFGGI